MKLYPLLVFIFCLCFSLPALAAEKAAATWTQRCTKEYKEGAPKRGQCEIFQRLVVKDTGKRVVEAAIGFPSDKASARGIFIVPLGVLLAQGMQMRIDDGEAYKFQARFCDNGGCFGYVDLNEQILEKMRKGSKLTITFTALDQKTINVEMTLKGFAKAVKEIG